MHEACLTIYFNSDRDQVDGREVHSTLTSWGQELRDLVESSGLVTEATTDPVIVVDAQAVLPPHWQKRLLRVFSEDSQVDLVTALHCDIPELSPLSPGAQFSGSAADLDAWINVLQTPQVFVTPAFNPQCFAARKLTDLDAGKPIWALSHLLVQSGATIGVMPEPIGDQHPLPAHPLADLQSRLASQPIWPRLKFYPGLDATPVFLHVLMDWGGGVQHWVDDFIAAHPSAVHLVLLSRGEFFRQRHGEWFELRWQGCDGPVLHQWHFSDPIKATQVNHPEYQAMLEQIQSHWAVSQVIVSSLIGHAMDCLDTGLPTLRVLHDYFPHWPSLNAELDPPEVDSDQLMRALARTVDEPFGSISAAELTSWQVANNRLLQSEFVKLVAPDVSVQQNLLKLPHADCYTKVRIIPHAVPKLRSIAYNAEQQPFKVLVPGRISPPKGQALILAVLESMLVNSSVHWIFLGPGKSADLLPQHPQVTVVREYQRSQLPELIETHQPHLAWLASSASESFSYVLSEMQMLGLPVMAQPVGALASRINADQTGFMVAADVVAVENKILMLQQDPDLLIRVRNALLKLKQPSSQAVNSAYAELLDAEPSSVSVPWFGRLEPQPEWQRLNLLQQQSEQLQNHVKRLQTDLTEKVCWAESLQDQIEHLETNLDLQHQEVKHLMTVVDEIKVASEQESRRLNDENTKLEQHLEQSQQAITELNQSNQQLTTRLDQTQQHLTATLNSRSWRFTKPLRVMTTYLRHKRNALKFRWAQLRSIPRRFKQSLKTRGLAKTLALAKGKLSKTAPPAAAKPQPMVTEYSKLSVPKASEPVVSVIIPVFNQFKHTYHCLESLAGLNETTGFEVIVIDDCSTDETPQHMPLIDGVRHHRQSVNGGFIESCNTGAAMAQGEYLLFLNNDTEVLPNAIDALVETFTTRPDAGLVGSQLLYPDGRLQEAGGIVFSDGSGWNYGRLEQPTEPEYQHLRAVSYCSGASIMIRKALFEQLGCFDERYKPAYYEDTDLAFSVRQQGLQVYYQPASQVIHFEGISSGTDLASGTKRYQVVNQQKFLDKWDQMLATQTPPGFDIERSRFQQQPTRVLILDACTPTPDQDSGSLRMVNLMQIFIDLGYHVAFAPENMAFFDQYTVDLQRIGVECAYGPKYKTPLSYIESKGGYFDLIILSRYYVAAPVMDAIRDCAPKAKVWFDTVDLHYLRETRMAELADDAGMLKAANQTKNQELAVASACDLTLVVSPYEQQVLAAVNPDLKVAVLSNIHEIYGCRLGYGARRDLMFIGGYQHTPNVDGILWFVAEIWPQIHAALPDVKLHIIGSKAPPEVKALGAQSHIEFHGFVEDIQPFMESVRMAVAPLRFGAGVKGKVNMSMSYGQPVVGTKVAVEGMHTTHAQDVMMADEPEAFAEAVIQVYQDPELWQRLSTGGLANVENWFSFAAAKRQIQQLLGNR